MRRNGYTYDYPMVTLPSCIAPAAFGTLGPFLYKMTLDVAYGIDFLYYLW